jgi:hypothetical protein
VTVAALYVDPKGVYAGLPDVEVWDEARDARTYAGPWPVVAHPPCARWCRLAGMIEKLHGYRVGDDGGCFAAALAAVRRFGGVLEHPAHSLAWPAFGLPRPAVHGWTTRLDDPGFATEVEQGQYGHALRKPTWLYAVGLDPPELRWRKGDGHAPSHRGAPVWWGAGHLSQQQRERLTIPTPLAFRDVLLAMARSAQPSLAIL